MTVKLSGLLLTLSLLFTAPLAVADDAPYPGTVTVPTPHAYAALIGRLEQAIAANGMGLVARASASGGAAKRGVTIPGNEVLMVFRNDYAVRMLAASVPAGIEAPLRIYVTENADGTANITYRRPSAVFAPYRNKALDTMAAELDPVVAKIVAAAGGK
ncbi:MAG: hypothetical protein CVV05_05565 [Gammaproteobacteria bacterium HGW-Gammaproteobacteria-1]|jgi:uncharacterized protein (DUF302 family)|nr:MAG: hypothetical protein CVV05_05565 [Gammaproteobacteria bacterium HGW-Gammaproteobacteria-1]